MYTFAKRGSGRPRGHRHPVKKVKSGMFDGYGGFRPESPILLQVSYGPQPIAAAAPTQCTLEEVTTSDDGDAGKDDVTQGQDQRTSAC